MLQKLWNDPAGQLVLWSVVLAMMIAVGLYVLGRIRAAPAQKESSASELLSKCRELHSRGGLTDAESRTIKTQLAAQLERELKGNGETG